MTSNSGCGLSAGTMSESVMRGGMSICVPIVHELVTKEVMKDSLIKACIEEGTEAVGWHDG